MKYFEDRTKRVHVVEDIELSGMSFKEISRLLEDTYQSVPPEHRDDIGHLFWGGEDDLLLNVWFYRQSTDAEIAEERRDKELQEEEDLRVEKENHLNQIKAYARKYPKEAAMILWGHE